MLVCVYRNPVDTVTLAYGAAKKLPYPAQKEGAKLARICNERHFALVTKAATIERKSRAVLRERVLWERRLDELR